MPGAGKHISSLRPCERGASRDGRTAGGSGNTARLVHVTRLLPTRDWPQRGLRTCSGDQHRLFSQSRVCGVGGRAAEQPPTGTRLHSRRSRQGAGSGHGAHTSLSLPRTHADFRGVTVATRGRPRRPLVGSCSQARRLLSSRPPGGLLGCPGHPPECPSLQQDRRVPTARSPPHPRWARSALGCRQA